MSKKNYKCLMIETKDNRKFFTQEENLPELIEFSKTFGAEISVVKMNDEPEVLDLIDLATAMCSMTKTKVKPEFEILETKVDKPQRNRTKILRDARKIRKYIKELLLAGEVVQLSTVAKKFKHYKLTLACFCNHLREVRKELEVEKIGHGKYMLTRPN